MDEEEKNLIESIENADIKDFESGSDERKSRIESAAREHSKSRETKMNIRIHRDELDRIKTQASKEGLKYQTFVKSVLHKYITGQLKEDNKQAG
jgi:predicted DNA binding CopG/RHH family protein